jgi:hypothetical protein
MKIFLNEGNQIHNVISSSGSDFLTSYDSDSASGSTSQKVTVPPDPVPVPQHCVFEPPGSGSVSQRYESGSFYHQANIVRKTLTPTDL